MGLKNIYNEQDTTEVLNRINKLTPESQALWGKMSVAQMLAHCCVTYEMVYDNVHPKATGIKKLLLKWFVKGPVTNEKPYPKNSRTAPQFIIADPREFDKEKKRLVEYIIKTQQAGETYFEGLASVSFGRLTATEWNNTFYKHLDHHLKQFGV